MSVTQRRADEISGICAEMRRELIKLLFKIQTGHPGGSLSCCEILAALYFHHMRVDPLHPDMPERDRLVLSKGHAAPMLYLCLAYRGFFPRKELGTLRQLDSRLQGHPDASKTPGVDLSSGPLGLGLSAAVGMALAAGVLRRSYRVYAVLGDGELQEGGVWEAAMACGKFRPANLTIIVDHNGVQLDGTNDEIMPLGDLKAKFSSFGLHSIDADGHDILSLSEALDEAAACRKQTAVIIARTVKGKGVSFMEGQSAWHGKPITYEDYERAMQELYHGGGVK
jgi:transketolase